MRGNRGRDLSMPGNGTGKAPAQMNRAPDNRHGTKEPAGLVRICRKRGTGQKSRACGAYCCPAVRDYPVIRRVHFGFIGPNTRIISFFYVFFAFFPIFSFLTFENAEKECIFLYRLFFHTDRTPEPPVPIPGPARGEKELQT